MELSSALGEGDLTAQLAQLFERAPGLVVLLKGPDHVFEYANPAYRRLIGVDQLVGRPVREALPEVVEQGFVELLDQVYRTGDPYVGEAVPVRLTRGGESEVRYFDFVYQPVAGRGGRIRGIFGQGAEITDRVRALAALSESEQRLRATYENAFAAIGEVDRKGRFLRVNEQFSVITGYSRDELLELSIWDITHPDDAAVEREMFARQMAGLAPVYSLEKRYIQKEGREIWIELAASTVSDPDGRPLYGIRVARDITDRRRWNERQALLIHELNHRVKNTLATVQSIAAQSARTAANPAAAHEAFIERLMALAQAHDVLTRQQWEGADLAVIVEGAVQPFGGGASERFEVRGPSVWLDPRRALALALALHELATNAVKHGALGAPEGCVRLHWRVLGPSQARRLELTWRESGGPQVNATRTAGFGTRLLERGLARDLGGRVSLDYAATGLVCRIESPLEDTPLGL